MLRIVTLFTSLFSLLACSHHKVIAPEFESYPALGLGTVESDSYELKKIIDLDTSDTIFKVHYVSETQRFIVSTSLITHLLLNKKGDLLDDYANIRGMGGGVPDGGVYFDKDYYIDWPLTGEREKKSYSKQIDINQLSKTEFEQLYNQAEVAHLKIMWQGDGETDLASCLLKINGDWVLLKTELPNARSVGESFEELANKVVMFGYPTKNNEPYSSVEDLIIPWYDWLDKENPIYIAESKRLNKAAIRISSQQVFSGWNTESYFNLMFAGEILKFKTSAFKENEGEFSPDIRLFIHPEDPELGILIALKTQNLEQQVMRTDGAGVYVIRKIER